ncbi:hypothetical protein [Gloeobacter kilaueensis]|uniref:hypothetical protein n=1 Tax=Gloeobacter kilaueensis TaxID=1416614 RepID=UPI001651ADBA|nr:hypothetical protein [Gloeobacter kilaueensis]
MPEEINVCPASSGVVDPEFDSTSSQMTYFDQTQNLIRVATVTANGTIAPPSCKGPVVAPEAVLSLEGFPLKNGPEWARSERGLEIFYTSVGPDEQNWLARAFFDGSWKHQLLAMGQNRALPLASVDVNDTQPRILYARLLEEGGYDLAWRESTQATSEAAFPASITQSTGGAPRWVSGQRAITTALSDAGGIVQAVRYWIDSGRTEFLTADAGDKDEVWMWQAPEFNGESIFFAVVDEKTIRIYRRIGGLWTAINAIDPSTFSAKPKIFSPEPFVYKGRSYISLQLSTAKYDPSEIWIAAVDPAAPLVRQISDPAQPNVVRSEPEWIATPKGAYVFFNHIEKNNQFSLWRAKTGL